MDVYNIHTQALIRRSQAYESLSQLTEAQKDMSTVLSLGPSTCGQKIYKLAEELNRRLLAAVSASSDSQSHLLRKASVEESTGIRCFCLEPSIPGFDSVRLRCRCVVHEHCMVRYLRSKLEDKTMISDRGVVCPFSCGKHVWIDDVDALVGINRCVARAWEGIGREGGMLDGCDSYDRTCNCHSINIIVVILLLII